MQLTEDAMRALEAARFKADPETEATLDYIVRTLTSPEADGMSMIERTYRTCEYRNQRNAEVWAAGSAFLHKSFKNKAVYFAVDCPDEGHVTFHLAVSDSQRDLHATPQAHRDWNVNLLRPKEEWVVPVLSRRVESDRPKSGANSGAKPSAGHARVEQNNVQKQAVTKPARDKPRPR